MYSILTKVSVVLPQVAAGFPAELTEITIGGTDDDITILQTQRVDET